MPLAQKCSEIASYIEGLLETNKVSLQLADVWFGDQQLLPHTPSACVIVGATEFTSAGSPRRVQADFEVQVLIYHCKLQDQQVTELECSQRAEATAALLNAIITGHGILVGSFVTKIEPGFVDKNNGQTWYKTSRVTFSGFSLFNLPLGEV